MQARFAFATYLSRVEERLMAEIGNMDSDDLDATNEQMVSNLTHFLHIEKFGTCKNGSLNCSQVIVIIIIYYAAILFLPWEKSYLTSTNVL